VHGDDPQGLPAPLRRRPALARAGRGAGRQELRADLLPHRRARRHHHDAAYAGTVSYLDSCSGLRELGIKAQPRLLLGSVGGLQLAEMADTEVCCGFGGSFCVKYPEISGRLADDKLARLAETGADTLLGGDLGCLLHLAGRMKRCGSRSRSSTPPKSWPAWPTATASAARRRAAQ
jgi:Fe-S oxidoreductase